MNVSSSEKNYLALLFQKFENAYGFSFQLGDLAVVIDNIFQKLNLNEASLDFLEDIAQNFKFFLKNYGGIEPKFCKEILNSLVKAIALKKGESEEKSLGDLLDQYQDEDIQGFIVGLIKKKEINLDFSSYTLNSEKFFKATVLYSDTNNKFKSFIRERVVGHNKTLFRLTLIEDSIENYFLKNTWNIKVFFQKIFYRRIFKKHQKKLKKLLKKHKKIHEKIHKNLLKFYKKSSGSIKSKTIYRMLYEKIFMFYKDSSKSIKPLFLKDKKKFSVLEDFFEEIEYFEEEVRNELEDILTKQERIYTKMTGKLSYFKEILKSA